MPLSHQTVARRVKGLSDNVKLQLQTNVKNCKYFSLALDESTDVNDISQLLVCIRTVDENFIVCEELLRQPHFTGLQKASTYLTALCLSSNRMEVLRRVSVL